MAKMNSAKKEVPNRIRKSKHQIIFFCSLIMFKIEKSYNLKCIEKSTFPDFWPTAKETKP